MLVLGIAGPLGSGKSTVLRMLQDLGAATLRADDVSRELLRPGQRVLERARAAFGEEFFAEDGTLRRNRLAELIFADAQAREQLNQIMHPPMVARLRQRVEDCRQGASPPEVLAIEAAILYEMGLAPLTDKLVLVTAPAAVRTQRLQDRDGLSEEEARHRVKLHDEMGLDKIEADYTINTAGDLADTRRQVEELWAWLVTLPKAQGD